MAIATDSVMCTKIRKDNMKRLHSLFPMALAGVLAGLSSAAFAEHQDSSTTKDWRWEQIEPLFLHGPGTRWVYALSGKQYANDSELHVEVKGQQHVPHLKQEVLPVEETHPATATDTTPEILPVLYYPREGYIAYHIHPEKRETVAVKVGEYKDCAPVKGTVNRGDGSGYRYQEWYAPGVGLVKSTTTNLLNGEVLLHKNW